MLKEIFLIFSCLLLVFGCAMLVAVGSIVGIEALCTAMRNRKERKEIERRQWFAAARRARDARRKRQQRKSR